VSGTRFFIELTNLETKIQEADLVITGEGKFDEQTLQGKVINGIAELAQKYDIPVIVIYGASEMDGEKIGIKKVYSVMNISSSVEEAMRDTKEKVADLTFQMMKDNITL